MLYVLVVLLKIIGIILALFLGLLILILAAPIRYSFQMDKEEMMPVRGQIKVTWFCSLLYMKAGYIDKMFDYRVRIFGYQILGNQKEFQEKTKKKQKHKDERRKKKSDKQKEQEKSKREKLKQDGTKEEAAELRIQSVEDKADAGGETKTIEQTKNIAENKTETIKKEKNKNSAKKDCKSHQKKKKRLSPAGRLPALKETAAKLKNLFQEYRGQQLLIFFRQSIIRILKHILPRKLKGYIRFGFDDPAVTGIITGIAAIFYPKYQKVFSLEPDFGKICFETECAGKGRIHLGFFLYMLIRSLLNQDVRKLIKHIK